MASADKKSVAKTDKANGHCHYLSKGKKEVKPAISHIVDAIKTIVHCSKDEDFRRRCFAIFEVEDFDDFSQTLRTELRTIARKRYGGLSDSLQEKELNANNNNSMNMEKGNCNFDDLELLEEGSLYEVSTTSKGGRSPVGSQSTSTNANVTHDYEMATENQDSLLDFSSNSDWNTTKAESKECRSGQIETTITNLTVKKGTTVLRPEGEFPNQDMPLISPSTSLDKQLLKDSNTMSKQTSFEIPVKISEGTQECETRSSKYEPYHFSKFFTDREDDWSNDFSWDDLGTNTKSSYSPPEGCLPGSNNSIKETVKQRREEDQCVPSAGNDTTSATQPLSLDDTLDDFESLAEIF